MLLDSVTQSVLSNINNGCVVNASEATPQKSNLQKDS